MESSATQRAVSLPEICACIFEFLTKDMKSLAAAALVNRTWAEQAGDIIWRHPPVEALLAIPKTRRQNLAKRVRVLRPYRAEEEIHHQLADLAFTSLRTFHLDYTCSEGRSFPVAQYIHHSLTSITFCGANPPADTWTLLRQRSPRLRRLVLSQTGSGPSVVELTSLLEQRPRLEHLLLSDDPDPIAEDLFISIAGHPGIKDLVFGPEIEPSAFMAVAKAVARPFPALTKLCIASRFQPLSSLLSLLRKLERLSVELSDAYDARVIPRLASQTDLKKLELHFDHEVQLHPVEALALQAFPRLTDLSLSSQESINAFDLTAKDFETVVRRLPRLKEFRFRVETTLDSSSLISLGKHCRFLRICEILGSYDFRPLVRIGKPLFPKLQQLTLDYVRCAPLLQASTPGVPKSFEERATLTAIIIRQHFPRLRRLELAEVLARLVESETCAKAREWLYGRDHVRLGLQIFD